MNSPRSTLANLMQEAAKSGQHTIQVPRNLANALDRTGDHGDVERSRFYTPPDDERADSDPPKT